MSNMFNPSRRDAALGLLGGAAAAGLNGVLSRLEAEESSVQPGESPAPAAKIEGSHFPSRYASGFARTAGGSGRDSNPVATNVIQVKSASQSSLEAALREGTGSRFVFLPSGATIALSKPLVLSSNLTLTGGLSGLPGVTFTGAPVIIPPGASDVVLSQFRFRKGSSLIIGRKFTDDSSTSGQVRNVVVDHVSFARSNIGGLNIHGAECVTVSNCLFVNEVANNISLSGSPEKDRSIGILIKGSNKITIGTSIFMALDRAIFCRDGGQVEVINCYVADCGPRPGDHIAIDGPTTLRIAGNIFLRTGLRGKVADEQRPVWIDPKLCATAVRLVVGHNTYDRILGEGNQQSGVHNTDAKVAVTLDSAIGWGRPLVIARPSTSRSDERFFSAIIGDFAGAYPRIARDAIDEHVGKVMTACGRGVPYNASYRGGVYSVDPKFSERAKSDGNLLAVDVNGFTGVENEVLRVWAPSPKLAAILEPYFPDVVESRVAGKKLSEK